jgi:hypothetical protein
MGVYPARKIVAAMTSQISDLMIAATSILTTTLTEEALMPL